MLFLVSSCFVPAGLNVIVMSPISPGVPNGGVVDEAAVTGADTVTVPIGVNVVPLFSFYTIIYFTSNLNTSMAAPPAGHINRSSAG